MHSSYGKKPTPMPSRSHLPTPSPPKPSSRYVPRFLFPSIVRFNASLTSYSTFRNTQDFLANPHFAQKWTGLRQDSGDPYAYAPRAKEVYEQLGVDYRQKVIIFSDALNVEKALKLKKQCDELGFKCASPPIRTSAYPQRVADMCGTKAPSGSARRCRMTS